MSTIPENFQEKRSRIEARLDPNQLEDLNFELLNLPFATAKRLERFQSQSEFAYFKVQQKLERRFQEFERNHPVWTQENQDQANLLLDYERETLQYLTEELEHLDRDLWNFIDTLPGDPNNYDLTQDNQVSDFLIAKETFEPFVRGSEKVRAGSLRQIFEELQIPITVLDIGLGAFWQELEI